MFDHTIMVLPWSYAYDHRDDPTVIIIEKQEPSKIWEQKKMNGS